MADWQLVTGWPARSFRRCVECGGQEEQEPTLQGYHGWDVKLAEPCGVKPSDVGMFPPPGVAFLGGMVDPRKRYPYFEMRYMLRQPDGSVAMETIPFPVAESWGIAVSEAEYEGKPKRGAGGQRYE